MPEIPADAKKPADHRPKKPAAQTDASVPYTFTHDDVTYTFEKPVDAVLTPGWVRVHRRMDQVDMTFTLLEEIAGEKALAAIDDMSFREFGELSEAIRAQTEPMFR